MKKSLKYGLIGAAAVLAAGLVPYELKTGENGEFSYTSLLLGVYNRRRPDGKNAVTITFGNAPCFTEEARQRRDAALRHSIEAAAEQELFADEDDPTEGTAAAAAPETPAVTETSAAPEAPAAAEPAAPAEEAAPDEAAPEA